MKRKFVISISVMVILVITALVVTTVIVNRSKSQVDLGGSDVRYGWVIQIDLPETSQKGTIDSIFTRCLPNADVLVSMYKGELSAAQSSICPLSTPTPSKRYIDLPSVYGYNKFLHYGCAPGSTGLGSGVINVIYEGQIASTPSDACTQL